MPSQVIQWFPGHMAKTERLISENIKNVDFIIEILDARVPISSRNPDIVRLTSQKPRIILLNKSDLADDNKTSLFCKKYSVDGSICIPCNCINGKGFNQIKSAYTQLCAEKLQSFEKKGMSGRKLKAMVVGVPNVGKSSFINKISGEKRAKVEDRPGVTLNKQWFSTTIGIDLMDMPGVLWPKFENQSLGENLALTGAVKDDILDIESLACTLLSRLRSLYPEMLNERYKLTEDYSELNDYELLELVCKKRGFLLRGGIYDTEKGSKILLDEFRGGKIGKITLDLFE